MAWLFAKSYALVLWIVLGAARLAGRSVWSFILAVVALLGEEFRRWAGLAVWGVLLVGAGKLALHAPAATRRPLLLTVLLLLGIWAIAVRRAAHMTRENNLRQVRARKAFRELSDKVDKVGDRIGDRIRDGAAARARGTPFEGIFASNRQRRDQAAARQAEEASQARTRAEAEAEAAAADEARRTELAVLEPDPYAHRR